VYASVSEIGDTENISKSYVSRILRLALLAPDMVEAILSGQADQALMLEQLERPPPASWCEQRRFARPRTVAVGITFSAEEGHVPSAAGRNAGTGRLSGTLSGIA
jgi:hypothetical protein